MKIPTKEEIIAYFRNFRLKTKYIVVLACFFVLFCFIGEQNIFATIKRSRTIRRTQKQLMLKREQIEQCKRDIRMLENTDSLEQIARERYYMHADSEDVYLVAD